jgi:hypothetical protein
MTREQRERERKRIRAELDQIEYMLENCCLEWWESEQLKDDRAFLLLDLALVGGEHCESKKRVWKFIARLAEMWSSVLQRVASIPERCWSMCVQGVRHLQAAMKRK